MLFVADGSKIRASLGAAVLAGALALPPVARAQQVEAPLYDLLASEARFQTTTTLFNISGLVERARGPLTFTIFAPTEAAWADRSGVKGELLAYMSAVGRSDANDPFPDTSRIIRVIRSWTIRGVHPLSEFAGKTVTLTNLDGLPIVIDGTGGQLSATFTSTVDRQPLKVNVELPPMIATNGIIYPTDNVSVQ